MQSIRQVKPRLVFVDSKDMIIEAKTAKGLRRFLAGMCSLAADESIGNPHIVLISHLNKQGKLKGNSDIEYLCDFVALLDFLERGHGFIEFKNTKNRDWERGHSSIHQHTGGKVKFIKDDRDDSPMKSKYDINHIQVLPLRRGVAVNPAVGS